MRHERRHWRPAAGVSGLRPSPGARRHPVAAEWRSLAAGGIYLDPAIANKAGEASGQWVDLSERELEILRLAALGHSNKEIAAQLNLSVKSVETYEARGMDKLGFHSRVQLVGHAVAEGWLKEV